MEGILKIFANNVRVKRQQLGISQERLGEMSNLHRTYIGSIERAEKNISIISAQKIANALQVTLSELLQK